MGGRQLWFPTGDWLTAVLSDLPELGGDTISFKATFLLDSASSLGTLAHALLEGWLLCSCLHAAWAMDSTPVTDTSLLCPSQLAKALIYIHLETGVIPARVLTILIPHFSKHVQEMFFR